MNRSGASARPAAGWDGVSLNQMTPNNQLHRTRKQRRFACCLRAGELGRWASRERGAWGGHTWARIIGDG